MGVLGTRTLGKVARKTQRFADLLSSLDKPVWLVDVRRSGAGGQGSWGPNELTNTIPRLMGSRGKHFAYVHLPCAAPSPQLLERWWKATKSRAPLSPEEIAKAVEAIREGRSPEFAAWRHWQVFKEGYLAELDETAVLAARAFAESAAAIGGTAVYLCAEAFAPGFDDSSQDAQDQTWCHRYTLSSRVAESLRQDCSGIPIRRVNLALDHAQPQAEAI